MAGNWTIARARATLTKQRIGIASKTAYMFLELCLNGPRFSPLTHRGSNGEQVEFCGREFRTCSSTKGSDAFHNPAHWSKMSPPCRA
jgi:hypothetical protein